MGDGKFFFLGQIYGEGDVVHGPGRGCEILHDRSEDRACDEVRRRDQGLVEGDKGEVWILAEQVVKKRGAASPMPKNEDGRFFDGELFDAGPVDGAFE